MAGQIQTDQLLSNSGLITIPTGHNLVATDNPTATSQVAPVSYLDARYIVGQYAENTLANLKITLSGTAITFTTQTGAISATNPVFVPIPLSATAGASAFQSVTSAITLTLPSGTINQRLCNVNTTDGQATFASSGTPSGTTATGIEFFLYYVNDGTDRIGISRSPLHTHVPANYAHTSTASTITVVASAATAWDAMIVSGTAITTPANATCVCLGPAVTATVDGSSTTAGRFSSVAFTTDYLPRWNNRNSRANFQHSIRADTAGATTSGFGSTDTKIRKYTNNTVNLGTAIQYFSAGGTVSSGGIGGAELYIGEDGIYTFMFNDNPTSTTAQVLGFTNGSSQRTTSVLTVTLSTILGPLSHTQNVANISNSVTWTGYLAAGSIVRPHTAGISVGTSPTIFTADKIGWQSNSF